LLIPVLSIMSGTCLGAGLEVTMASTIRIATEDALGMPETGARVRSVVHACLLPRLVGWGSAREMLYCVEGISAQKALEWGLLNEVVYVEYLESRLEAWKGKVAVIGPQALRAQKRLMCTWEERVCRRDGVSLEVLLLK
jgi:enoyl-CoA hydratase/carnithine racemase